MTATVLIVDDNRMLARFTAQNLAARLPGLDVQTAHSIAEARAIAVRVPLQVALMDWHLPDGDGADLLGTLLGVAPDLKVVLIGGTEPLERLDPALASHVMRVIAKPFEADEIIAGVRAALDPATRRGPARAAGAPARAAALDHHEVINRLAGLLAGLRAFSSDLEACAEDPRAVRAAVTEYSDNLVQMVHDLAALVRVGSAPPTQGEP